MAYNSQGLHQGLHPIENGNANMATMIGGLRGISGTQGRGDGVECTMNLRLIPAEAKFTAGLDGKLRRKPFEPKETRRKHHLAPR